MSRLGRTLRVRCRSLLKSPCAARDVLRSRGREFYNIGIHRFTQRWQMCIGNDEDSWKNSVIIAKRCKIIHANFTLIAITLSRKTEIVVSYRPSHFLVRNWNVFTLVAVKRRVRVEAQCLDADHKLPTCQNLNCFDP
jgi:hypothetical protein